MSDKVRFLGNYQRMTPEQEECKNKGHPNSKVYKEGVDAFRVDMWMLCDCGIYWRRPLTPEEKAETRTKEGLEKQATT